MTNEEQAWVERWITVFCETPPIIDVELMQTLIAEHEAAFSESLHARQEARQEV